MLHKCLSVTFVEFLLICGGTVSGPVAFLWPACLKRELTSASSALGKSKRIEKSKLFLIFSILGSLSYFVMIPSIIS